MKKTTYLFLMVICLPLRSMACDACGGSLGAGFYGILPQFQSHFIGMRYSVSFFDASIVYNSQFLDDVYAEDTYQTIDIMGRYSFNRKWQIVGNIPVVSNLSSVQSNDNRITGIGDPRLMAYYRLLNTAEKSAAKWQHAILLGAGVKFPLGEFKERELGEEEEGFINENVQVGTGSLDYLFSAIHTTKFENTGIRLETVYKVNGRNELDYRFGNQFNIAANLFQWMKIGKSILMPNAGLYYESGKEHMDGSIIPLNTGGNATFGVLQMQWYVQNIIIDAMYMRPLHQDYNTDKQTSINASDRFSVSLLFNITSEKNPFKMD